MVIVSGKASLWTVLYMALISDMLPPMLWPVVEEACIAQNVRRGQTRPARQPARVDESGATTYKQPTGNGRP